MCRNGVQNTISDSAHVNGAPAYSFLASHQADGLHDGPWLGGPEEQRGEAGDFSATAWSAVVLIPHSAGPHGPWLERRSRSIRLVDEGSCIMNSGTFIASADSYTWLLR